MFEEDRFSEKEDYSIYYNTTGGCLSAKTVNNVINEVYNYLDEKYPSETYRHNFPSLEDAINNVIEEHIPPKEIKNIIETFSYHEHGIIPPEYVNVLKKLKTQYTLALVIDIWAPKTRWVNTFKQHDILNLFSAISFSSDHGIVKPSPKPFERVINEIHIPKQDCLVIGDSVRRDLGGALAAGVDCVLVGGAVDSRAVGTYPNLLDFYNTVS